MKMNTFCRVCGIYRLAWCLQEKLFGQELIRRWGQECRENWIQGMVGGDEQNPLYKCIKFPKNKAKLFKNINKLKATGNLKV